MWATGGGVAVVVVRIGIYIYIEWVCGVGPYTVAQLLGFL